MNVRKCSSEPWTLLWMLLESSLCHFIPRLDENIQNTSLHEWNLLSIDTDEICHSTHHVASYMYFRPSGWTELLDSWWSTTLLCQKIKKYENERADPKHFFQWLQTKWTTLNIGTCFVDVVARARIPLPVRQYAQNLRPCLAWTVGKPDSPSGSRICALTSSSDYSVLLFLIQTFAWQLK